MKKLTRSPFWALILSSLCLSGCDLLRLSPFEVLSWNPGEGFMEEPGNIEVSVLLSHDPDRLSVERYFSLSEDGINLEGDFLWEGERIYFIPRAPLERNHEYVIGITADAKDNNGLSMDRSFEGSFSTRPPVSRPKLVSVFPEDGGTMTQVRGSIRLEFSEDISISSCTDSVSLSPALQGIWVPQKPDTAVFIPGEDWKPGTRYTLGIQSSLKGKTGLSMGEERSVSFTAGTDREKPFLTGAWRIEGMTETLLQADDGEGTTVNSGWGKTSVLLLRFPEPVDILSVKQCLSCEAVSGLVLEAESLYGTELRFSLKEMPLWGSRFIVRLGEGVKDAAGNTSTDSFVFTICVDGESSRPPEFRGIRFPMAPGDPLDCMPRSYTVSDAYAGLPLTAETYHYPYLVKVESWIELYFETSGGAAIDPLEIARCFRVEATNGAVSFNPRMVVNENFSISEAVAGWENYRRLEVRGILTNSVSSGVVSFVIDSGFIDSNGNTGEEYRLPLLK
ncbi:MAG: Ig-like domain-containing protein [Treponema sp.]|jgi:hypothetical protein|nr:Ig-like domain-containing protein [Treponema sp.]